MTSRSELEYQTQRIKESIDVVTVIGGYVRLRKAGRKESRRVRVRLQPLSGCSLRKASTLSLVTIT